MSLESERREQLKQVAQLDRQSVTGKVIRSLRAVNKLALDNNGSVYKDFLGDYTAAIYSLEWGANPNMPMGTFMVKGKEVTFGIVPYHLRVTLEYDINTLKPSFYVSAIYSYDKERNGLPDVVEVGRTETLKIAELRKLLKGQVTAVRNSGGR